MTKNVFTSISTYNYNSTANVEGIAHHLLIFSQNYKICSLLWNTKEDILRNVNVHPSKYIFDDDRIVFCFGEISL